MQRKEEHINRKYNQQNPDVENSTGQINGFFNKKNFKGKKKERCREMYRSKET